MNVAVERDALVIRGEGAFHPPTADTVERLREHAELTGHPKDLAAYQRAADALATINKESEQ